MVNIEDILSESEIALKRDIESLYMSGSSIEELRDRLKNYVFNQDISDYMILSDYIIDEQQIGGSKCLIVRADYKNRQVFEFVLNKQQIREEKINKLI